MTFCLGIKVSEGLVGIADTRVISGNENISARKINVFDIEGRGVFLMTSGLRSVRDKAMAYFEEAMAGRTRSRWTGCSRSQTPLRNRSGG